MTCTLDSSLSGRIDPKNKKEKCKKKTKKALLNTTSIPRLLKVSLGKIICPYPNTVESIVHSC